MVRRAALIFPIYLDAGPKEAILAKNEGIANALQSHGVNVDVFAYRKSGISVAGEPVAQFSPVRPMRILQHHFFSWRLVANRLLREAYDFVWLRMPYTNLATALFLQRIRRAAPRCKIILEYGTYPYRNELSPRMRLHYDLNLPAEKLAHRAADFIVTYSGQTSLDGVPVIPIGNGIEVNRYSIVQKKTLADPISFISVSSLKPAHACERFLEGMARYRDNPAARRVHFHIVGDGPERPMLEALVRARGLGGSVTFHGFRHGAELDALYNQCHVAVSSLGFHRVGVKACSSLKNREYLAKGMPLILSTPDLDLADDLPHVRYEPVNEAPIDLAGVVSFAERLYASPDLHERIRTSSENTISWNTKMKTVLSYLSDSS